MKTAVAKIKKLSRPRPTLALVLGSVLRSGCLPVAVALVTWLNSGNELA